MTMPRPRPSRSKPTPAHGVCATAGSPISPRGWASAALIACENLRADRTTCGRGFDITRCRLWCCLGRSLWLCGTGAKLRN